MPNPEVGDRVRWFMARAWAEGVHAGHDCTGTLAHERCLADNPYSTTPASDANGDGQ